MLAVIVPAYIFFTQTPNHSIFVSTYYTDVSENVLAPIKNVDKVDINGYKKFIKVEAFITNMGTAPIKDQDFIEPISIASEGWDILDISNIKNSKTSDIIKWERVSNSKFESQRPLLLNPGDQAGIKIYVASKNKSESINELEIIFSTRVVGMDDLSIYEPIGIKPIAHKTEYKKISAVYYDVGMGMEQIVLLKPSQVAIFFAILLPAMYFNIMLMLKKDIMQGSQLVLKREIIVSSVICVVISEVIAGYSFIPLLYAFKNPIYVHLINITSFICYLTYIFYLNKRGSFKIEKHSLDGAVPT